MAASGIKKGRKPTLAKTKAFFLGLGFQYISKSPDDFEEVRLKFSDSLNRYVEVSQVVRGEWQIELYNFAKAYLPVVMLVYTPECLIEVSDFISKCNKELK